MDAAKKMFFQGVCQSNPENEPLLEDTKSSKRRESKDGVCSWLVALDIFFINFMVQGMGRVAAILYVDFMQVFHVQRQIASAPYSMQQSTRRLFGPLVGVIAQRYGVTAVTVAGCLISSISCAACYFTDDMTWITLSWGAVYGIGAALTGTVNMILIDQYFIKYRSSAYGFSISGTCFGAIFLPALFNVVLQKYGVHGAFLLMGSVIFLALPFAMLLREQPEIAGKSREATPTYRSFSEKSNSSVFCTTFLSTAENSRDSSTNSFFRDSNSSSVILAKRRLSFTSVSLEKVARCERVRSGSYSGKNLERGVDEQLKLHTVSGGNLEERAKRQKKNRATEQESEKLIYDLETSEKYNEGNSKNNDARFIESKYLDDSSAEKSTDMLSKANRLEESDIPNTVEVSNSSLEEYNKNTPSTSKRKETMNYDAVFPVSNKATEGTATSSKSSLKKSKKHKRVFKSRKSKSSTLYDEDTLLPNRQQRAKNYKNEIDFNVFYNNKDLVIDLLSRKIPLDEEEALPLPSDVTQSSLESSDTDFIFKQLQRIENQLQLPGRQVDLFLSEIREKLRRFSDLINADRDQFIQEKRLNFGSKELVYKDIQNTTIRKPNSTIEVTEYSLEIPADLYIPVKLEELQEISSEHIASLYPSHKQVLEVVDQLKRLHVLFRTPTSEYSFKNNAASHFKDSRELNKSVIRKTPPEERRVTWKEQIRIAVKLHLNLMFLLVCLCRSLSMISFFPVITSVVDFALDKGLSRSQAVYAVAFLSTGDLVGRVGTGWITDRELVSDKNYMAIALILQGAATALLPMVSGAAMVLPTLVIFALFQGSLLMMHPVVLTKYIRSHEKYIALGFINFLPGILSFVIPYYIGYFRDHLGSYDGMYFVNSGLSAFLGCMWFLEPILSRFGPPPSPERENAPFSL